MSLQKRLSTRLLAFTLAERGKWLCLKKVAFTLAEVLIVIGIVGMIADMTIPTLVQSYQNQVMIVRLKKNYSAISQTTNRAIAEYGPIETWTLQNSGKGAAISQEFFDTYMKPYLNVVPNACTNKNTGSCYLTEKYMSTGTGATCSYSKYYLADGTIVCISAQNSLHPGCWNKELQKDTCPQITGQRVFSAFVLLDLNGNKKPNTIGFDQFFLSYNIDAVRNTTFNNTKGTVRFPYQDYSEESLVATNHYACNKGKQGQTCGTLIQRLGWQIPPKSLYEKYGVGNLYPY